MKALSDIIVTSSSAETILAQIPESQKIIFGPDRHLGGYLSRKFNREMLLWPGVCIVHEAFSETELLKLKAQHPGVPVAAHPECPPHIIDHADYVGSTSGILQYAKTMAGDTLIVATEPHIIHQMEKAEPTKTFIGAPGADGNCACNICPYMALNTMEKLYLALRDLQPQIVMDEGIRLAAKKSLDRMLEMASGTVGKGDLGDANWLFWAWRLHGPNALTMAHQLAELFCHTRFLYFQNICLTLDQSPFAHLRLRCGRSYVPKHSWIRMLLAQLFRTVSV